MPPKNGQAFVMPFFSRKGLQSTFVLSIISSNVPIGVAFGPARAILGCGRAFTAFGREAQRLPTELGTLREEGSCECLPFFGWWAQVGLLVASFVSASSERVSRAFPF